MDFLTHLFASGTLPVLAAGAALSGVPLLLLALRWRLQMRTRALRTQELERSNQIGRASCRERV